MLQRIHILVLIFYWSTTGWSQTTPTLTHFTSEGMEGTRLPAAINSDYRESSPVLSVDGRTLYFSRQDHPLNYGLQDETDIWVSTRLENGRWSRAINVGAPLNTRNSNRVAGICSGGTRLYLIHSGGQLPPGHSGLYRSEKQGRSWATPQPVQIDSFQEVTGERHFFPAIGEEFLLLSIEQAGSHGGRDLYVAQRKKGGSWTAPQNLGPQVNTSGDEARMVLAADGRTLYFSSNGLPGLGGTDIYLSRRLDDSWTHWSPPVNLGEDINSGEDDDAFSVSTAGDRLLLSRQVSPGNTDIYEFSLPRHLRPTPVTIVHGKVPSAYPMPVVSLVTTADAGYRLPERIRPQADSSFRMVLPGGEGLVSIFMKEGRSTQSYERTEERFAPSQCLTISGDMPPVLDTAPQQLMSSLQQMPEYQQREDAITEVAHQIRETRKQQLSFLKKVRAYQSRRPSIPFDPEILTSDSLVSIAEQYQAFLEGREEAGAFQTRKGVDNNVKTNRPDSSAERLRRLRQRYRDQHQRESAPPAGEPDAPASSSFEQYSREVWETTVEKLLPEIKRQLDSAVVAERLSGRRTSNQADAPQTRFLEERLQQLSNSRLPEEGQIMLPLSDWEGRLKKDLEAVLGKEVSAKLRAALSPGAEQALSDLLRQNHKSTHLAKLERTLQELIRQQIALEKSAEPEAFPSPKALGKMVKSEGYRELALELKWLPLEEGAVWPLNSVLFEPNSSQLLEISYAELERVASILRDHHSIGVEVAAYTHGGVSHLQAQRLSAARAAAVGRVLLKLGLNPANVQSRGYGRSFPLTSDDSAGGRYLNQRITLRLYHTEAP